MNLSKIYHLFLTPTGEGGPMHDKQKVTRKLSAILSADVKGYSRLMNEDEGATIGRAN